MIDAIFSQSPTPVAAKSNAPTTTSSTTVSTNPAVGKVTQGTSSSSVRMPSIRQALAGNVDANRVEESATTSASQSKNTLAIDHEFTENDLLAFWPEYTNQHKSEPHLYHTLSAQPRLKDGYVIEFDAENSVQLDQFRGLKHEIVGFFMRKLNNSKITVEIVLSKAQPEAKSLTDDNKLQDMMKRNPALLILRQKFSLDFS